MPLSSFGSSNHHLQQQQEHVQLRRGKKPSTSFLVVVKPSTVVMVLVASIMVLSLIVTLHVCSQALSSSSSSSAAAAPRIGTDSGSPMIGEWNASLRKKGQVNSATTIIRTSDDMEALWETHQENPATNVVAIFGGTPYCANKVDNSEQQQKQQQPCRLFLPVDTPDTKRSLSSVLLGPFVALQTWKGKKEIVQVHDNQDRSVLIHFNNKNDVVTTTTTSTQDGSAASLLMLLADGHGQAGHGVAQQVVTDLPIRLLRALEQEASSSTSSSSAMNNAETTTTTTTIQQVFKKAFLETDEIVLRDVEVDGGSTVVLTLHWGHFLYLVSAGDSTGVLAEWDQDHQRAVILESAVKHKPGSPEEEARIKAAGGTVIWPPGDPSSRVIIPSNRGPMFDSALAMSRCMGDVDGKRQGFLIAEPAVQVINLQEHAGKQLFVLVSSDGVTDFFPVASLMNRLGAAIFQTDKENQESLEQAVEGSLEHSSAQWQLKAGMYRDDMSLMVARIL